MKHSPFMPSFEQLPDTLPVFPLPNAIVMPGSNLPLNIFEPRYLNMCQDAMKSHQLIGMIQPRDNKDKPSLFPTGCAGRITRYLETHDGRLEINLSGICRFNIIEELSTTRGYRLIRPDWQAFESDFQTPEVATQDINYFTNTLRHYFEHKGMQADWEALEKLEAETLVNSMVTILPLTMEEKQVLLEAANLPERLQTFSALLESEFKDSSEKH
jgi:Lon protease-like protein